MLWTGLVRGIYQQVELRVKFSEGGEALLVRRRVQQAIGALVTRFGSLRAVRRRHFPSSRAPGRCRVLLLA